MATNFIDRTGQRFGMLTAVEPTRRVLSSGRVMPAWRLRCDCGAEVIAMTVNLRKGHHSSCGCLAKKRAEERRAQVEALRAERASAAEAKAEARAAVKKSTPVECPWHSGMPEYRVYRQMLQRCYLKTAPNYRFYGAKGVTVCDRWRFGEDGKRGYHCFIEDMGLRPEGLTLDRIDPFKPYGPGNCRWATWQEQAANKREHYLDPAAQERLRKARGAARRIVTPEIKREILARLRRGERQWPIARSLGISQTTVSYVKLGQR